MKTKVSGVLSLEQQLEIVQSLSSWEKRDAAGRSTTYRAIEKRLLVMLTVRMDDDFHPAMTCRYEVDIYTDPSLLLEISPMGGDYTMRLARCSSGSVQEQGMGEEDVSFWKAYEHVLKTVSAKEAISKKALLHSARSLIKEQDSNADLSIEEQVNLMDVAAWWKRGVKANGYGCWIYTDLHEGAFPRFKIWVGREKRRMLRKKPAQYSIITRGLEGSDSDFIVLGTGKESKENPLLIGAIEEAYVKAQRKYELQQSPEEVAKLARDALSAISQEKEAPA
jgi:hypothetical protein